MVPVLWRVSSVPLSAVGSVVFTVDSAEAGRAGAGVAVDTVGAVGSVLARVALTLVDVLLALCAPEAGQAGAQEAVHLVPTEASVAARVCGQNGALSLCFEVFAKCRFCFVYVTLIKHKKQRDWRTYWACSHRRWFRSCVH